MTTKKIPYLQERYKMIELEMLRGTHLELTQDDQYIVIEDIFDFMGKLNYLIQEYQFKVLKGFVGGKNE